MTAKTTKMDFSAAQCAKEEKSSISPLLQRGEVFWALMDDERFQTH
jgi:hypothetical protein